MDLDPSRELALRATERHMRCMARGDALGPWVVAACLLAISTLSVGDARAEHEAAAGTELEQLIEQFNGEAGATNGGGPAAANGSVHLEAWIEPGAERDQVVVVIEPRGSFKLVADPGITVTPTAQPGVQWLVPLPHRHVDSEIQYFTPPATVRLPFRAQGEAPLEILVEYAYCVVDYQCLFGEEVLTVAHRYD